MQHFFFSLVIILILVGLCYFVCLGLGSPELFQAYFWNTLGRALFFSGLRLRLGPAFSGLFFSFRILFSLWDLELGNMMVPAGDEGASSSEATSVGQGTTSSSSVGTSSGAEKANSGVDQEENPPSGREQPVEQPQMEPPHPPTPPRPAFFCPKK